MMLTKLAQHYGRGPLSLTEVADTLGLSVAYLEQIVPALRTHGFIDSQRGAKGGYVLTTHPEKIRMGAVIRALEERKTGQKLSVMPCANLDGTTDSCGHGDVCTGPLLWMRVRDAIIQALDSTTLADLAPETRRTLPLFSEVLVGAIAQNAGLPLEAGVVTELEVGLATEEHHN